MSARGKRIRFWVTLVIVLLAIGGAATGVYRLSQQRLSALWS